MGKSVVCAACRDSKVKCERLEHSDQCARCSRIGLVCSAAPPSQRGKRTSLSQLGARNKQRLAGVAGGASKDGAPAVDEAAVVTLGFAADYSSTEANRAAGAQFACMWTQLVKGPGAAANSRDLSIQKAARARLHNLPKLMVHAMGLCAHFGLCVEDIISSSHKSAPIPSTIDTYPAAMAAMLRASSGYATARCCTGGAVGSVTNASFEVAVLSKHELDTQVTDPAMPCQDLYGFGGSSYIHAHDIDVINDLVQRLFGIEQAEHAGSVELPDLVRVVDQRLHCYVPCSVHGMIHFASAEGHAIFLAIEYIPMGTPSPYDTPLLLANGRPPPPPQPLTEHGSPPAELDPSASMRLVPSSRPGVMQASGHSASVATSLELDELTGLADLTGDEVEAERAGALDNGLLFSSECIDALINDPDAIHRLVEVAESH